MMQTPSLVLIPLLLTTGILFISGIHGQENLFIKREHSLSKPYQGTGMTIPNWDFTGTTFVTASFIRLTPDEQSRQGSLWNSVPLMARNWEILFEFKVGGRGKDLFGDGFAFWYSKNPHTIGPVFGNEEFFSGLGIFMDTYANQNGAHSHGHPYISAMVNNGSMKYDHDRDGTHTETAGCEAKFRGVEQDTYVKVSYRGDSLSLYTDIDGLNQWKECFSVSGVHLPTGYHIGFSAATGELSDAHDIISIKTYEIESMATPQEIEERRHIVPQALKHAPHREHVDDAPRTSGLKIFFYIIFSILGLSMIGGAAFYFYNNQSVKKDRFY